MKTALKTILVIVQAPCFLLGCLYQIIQKPFSNGREQTQYQLNKLADK